MKKYLFLALAVAMMAVMPLKAQIRGLRQTELKEWQFSKDGSSWQKVTVPHSYNAIDGQSRSYYRGKATYRCEINVTNVKAHRYLVFEGAAQAATVLVNGTQVAMHKGGYTAFPVNITDAVKEGTNVIEVICDNTQDLEMIPVTSDFNKNGGLHNPVYLVQEEAAYFSLEDYGMYRLRVETPEVTEKKIATNVKAKIVNASGKDMVVKARVQLLGDDGRLGYQADRKIDVAAYTEYDFDHEFLLTGLHLWNGVKDPYMYTVRVELFNDNRMLDIAEARIGYRSIELDPERGFLLNGKPYSLRGVSLHQDLYGKASAMTRADYRRDYKLVKELGANFVRLAHYPHNDFAFQLADSLGLVVQTEIPWVNVCGVNAKESYFNNIREQMEEMINNLFNHPSIAFWGMWNELGETVNNNSLQGEFDAARVVSETKRLYELGMTLDPWRFYGVADDSVVKRPGYTDLQVDYVAENRYNGWYYNLGDFSSFSDDMNSVHEKMGVVSVSEYGVGNNPFCHVWNPVDVVKDDTKHIEEFANLYHESYIRQIRKMPWLNFTSLWIMFDFAVSNRVEGYMDSDDGVHFTENNARKNINTKGLVTRDRQTKKDVFYLYKSWWNHDETTVCITGKRLHYFPAGHDLVIKVYSNARTLTLYQNDKQVARLNGSGESTGIIWKFPAVRLKTESDTFKVVANDGTTDTMILSRQK